MKDFIYGGLNMKEELVSFNTAKLAKERGFDWKCHWYCCHKRRVPTNDKSFYPTLGEYKNFNDDNGNFYEHFSLSTQSLLQKWLREIYNIFLEPKQTSLSDTEWCFVDSNGNKLRESIITTYYDGYPKKGHKYEYNGLDEILQKALKLIK